MKVGVVGAGIGGLVAAVGFARGRLGYRVRAEPEAGAVGAGISLFGNGFRALEAVGLADAVRALGSAGRSLPALLRTPTGGRWWRLRRRRLPSCASCTEPICTGSCWGRRHRCRPAKPCSRSIRTARSRRRAGVERYDLVVGADGIGSAIRRSWTTDPGIR